MSAAAHDAADLAASGERVSIDDSVPVVDGQEVRPLHLTRASDVTPTTVRWLWTGRCPLGKPSLLAGPPGTGKTTLSLDIAARVSRGSGIPYDDAPPVRGSIVIISTEDDADDTIVPRLSASRADLDRCYIWGDETMLPVLPDDEWTLTAQLREYDCRLLVVDPLSALLSPDLNSHRDADVRRLFGALKRLARTLGMAIIGIAHLNKSTGQTALARVGGSGAWVAAARSVVLCMPDPEEQDDFIAASAKISNARRPSSIRIRRECSDTGALSLRWLGECSETADELVAPQPQDTRGGAKAFLAAVLADGPVETREVLRLAREEGLSERTVRRAKADLEVVVKKISSGPWVWSLAPNDPVEDGHPT